jgi:hypothetical protein
MENLTGFGTITLILSFSWAVLYNKFMNRWWGISVVSRLNTSIHGTVMQYEEDLDGWTEHLAVSYVRRPTNSLWSRGFFVIKFYPDMFRHMVAILRGSWVPYKLPKWCSVQWACADYDPSRVASCGLLVFLHTIGWRWLPVVTWTRYRKFARAVCKLLKRTKKERSQILSIVVAFFPVLTMCLTVLSLTAFLFVVMKNGLSFKRTESCLCYTRNMGLKMFRCRRIVR